MYLVVVGAILLSYLISTTYNKTKTNLETRVNGTKEIPFFFHLQNAIQWRIICERKTYI